MKLRGHRPVLAALLAGIFCPYAFPAAANVQAPPDRQTEKSERTPALPPVPPGVPTTAENVHLPTEGEMKLGREGVVEVEKFYKIIKSGPYNDRLQRVAREVVVAIQQPEIAAEYRRVYKLPRREDKSRRVPFEFTFKVINDKDVNAFSLAGGPIYVSKALLDYTASDHELAAVLAHECSHVAFHHVEQLIRKQKKVNAAQIWGLLATVIAGAAGGGAALSAASNLLIGGQLVTIAMTTGYGRELETEADRIGMMTLRHTQYQPLAMLTFMQKLNTDAALHGNPDGGILQSHPFANERAAAIRKLLVAQGVPVDLGSQREVSGAFRVEAVPMVSAGREQAELRLNGNLLYLVAAGEGKDGPVARAQRMAQQLEQLFHENITFNDVRLSPDKRSLWMKGVVVIQVYPEDASAAGSAGAADRAYKQIINALWKEKLSSTN